MALAGDLGRAGHAPEAIRTVAMVHLDKGEHGFAITGIDLDSEATVPDDRASELDSIAQSTKDELPGRQGVRRVPITLRIKLGRMTPPGPAGASPVSSVP